MISLQKDEFCVLVTNDFKIIDIIVTRQCNFDRNLDFIHDFLYHMKKDHPETTEGLWTWAFKKDKNTVDVEYFGELSD